MNRTVITRPHAGQSRCVRPVFPACPPTSLTEFNRELQELPLAMAYVPIQSWGDIYPPARALCRGTLFPQLDLPFHEVNVC